MSADSDRLQALYDSLTERLPKISTNPCGTCRICCTADGMSFQNVQEVEFDAIEERYGADRAARFRDYAERKRDDSGAFLHPVCPFYDMEAAGCGIYAHRPFSCRIFGRYRMQGTVLPEPCVFRGGETVVEKGQYFRKIPLARELRDLERRHAARAPRRLSTTMGGATPLDAATLERIRANVDPQDPLEMAVLAHLEGRHQDALQLFDQGLQSNPAAAYGHFYRANLLEEMQQPQAALQSYRQAAALEPDNPRFHLHLAIGLLGCEQSRAAQDAFARTVELDPNSGVAHGFLGYLLLAEGQSDEALPHLELAVQADPDNPYFRLRLGEALCRNGRREQAEPHLEVAARHPSTAAVAAKLRS